MIMIKVIVLSWQCKLIIHFIPFRRAKLIGTNCRFKKANTDAYFIRIEFFASGKDSEDESIHKVGEAYERFFKDYLM